MIGSGVFLVDADIARTANSPALVLGAWVVTGVLTMIGALSYGELAAMMPKAGGQYVYLRESLGPLWGFLYGWTLFLVIQTGTIAAVCVAFGKFLGVFFPSISTTHWLWHIAHVPAISVGPMVLGNMDIGLNTANLTGIVIVFLLAFVNMFGVKLGSMIQNIFTSAKALSLAALVLLTFTVGRNATAWTANFGTNWSGAGRCRRSHCAGESAGDPGRCSGRVAVFGGRLEQHHVHGRGSEESAAQYSTVAGPRHGVCADGLFFGDTRLFAGPADARRYPWNDDDGAGAAVRV
jgi:amino acid transporter